MKEEKDIAFFTKRLMDWHYNANHRSLPWKGEGDPYKIWLSEIILQQTRAEQGLPYYIRFAEAYPTVKHLANTTDESAYRLWQGLGYYARCRNMLATARHIVHELDGRFPETYEGLLALKGIGPYTAAAIASFAYKLPNAVVDGNVTRVLSRFFGIKTPFDTTEGKKEFSALAGQALYKEDSADYNQAIMDHGATICTPQQPRCPQCPLQERCIAYNKNLIHVLPVRSKKTSVRIRYFQYLILLHDNKVWLHRRDAKDIWQNLHEPLLIESESALERVDIEAAATDLNLQGEIEFEGSLTQKLTHQLIETRFYSMEISEMIIPKDKEGAWVPLARLKEKSFPKTLVSYFEKKGYF